MVVNFGPTNALSDSKGFFSAVLDPSMMPAYSNIFFIVFPDTVTSQLSFYTTCTDSPCGHLSAAAHPRAHSLAWGIPPPDHSPSQLLSTDSSSRSTRKPRRTLFSSCWAFTHPSFFWGASPLSKDFKLSRAKDSIKIIFIDVLLSTHKKYTSDALRRAQCHLCGISRQKRHNLI